MLNEITVQEETKIENVAENLYRRIEKETKKILKSQLLLLGEDDIESIKKVIYPEDDKALATYHYKDKLILGVKISEGGMGIEFDVPNMNVIKVDGEPPIIVSKNSYNDFPIEDSQGGAE